MSEGCFEIHYVVETDEKLLDLTVDDDTDFAELKKDITKLHIYDGTEFVSINNIQGWEIDFENDDGVIVHLYTDTNAEDNFQLVLDTEAKVRFADEIIMASNSSSLMHLPQVVRCSSLGDRMIVRRLVYMKIDGDCFRIVPIYNHFTDSDIDYENGFIKNQKVLFVYDNDDDEEEGDEDGQESSSDSSNDSDE